MNYSRISRKIVDNWSKARNQGKRKMEYTTQCTDVNALAVAIYARAPKLKVLYICNSNKIRIEL